MRGILLFVMVLVAMSKAGLCSAQSVEEDFNENIVVPVESNSLTELSTVGFLLDNTRTKNGRDFYEYFFQQWLTIQSDTTLISPDSFSGIGEELTISVDEQPAQGISTIVSMSVNDIMIWQQFLQPRLGLAELLAEDAAATLAQYIQNFQEFQKQLGSDDQQGTGIF